MKGFATLVLVSVLVLSCFAASASTNLLLSTESFASMTNASTAKQVRQQCEAITKSGTRCKRKAVAGEKLCRQHQRIATRKVSGSADKDFRGDTPREVQ